MSIYAMVFLMVALAALVFSIFAQNNRGGAWVAAIVAVMLMSNAYVYAGHPYPEVFMAAGDFLVCLAIYFVAAHRWELWLFLVVQFSMLASVLHLGVAIFVPTADFSEIYMLTLELANYAAVLLIGGISGYVHARRFGVAAFDHWRRVLPAGLAAWTAKQALVFPSR